MTTLEQGTFTAILNGVGNTRSLGYRCGVRGGLTGQYEVLTSAQPKR